MFSDFQSVLFHRDCTEWVWSSRILSSSNLIQHSMNGQHKTRKCNYSLCHRQNAQADLVTITIKFCGDFWQPFAQMSCHRPLNDQVECFQKLIFHKNFEDFRLAHQIQEYFPILSRHTSLFFLFFFFVVASNQSFLVLIIVLYNISKW